MVLKRANFREASNAAVFGVCVIQDAMECNMAGGIKFCEYEVKDER